MMKTQQTEANGEQIQMRWRCQLPKPLGVLERERDGEREPRLRADGELRVEVRAAIGVRA